MEFIDLTRQSIGLTVLGAASLLLSAQASAADEAAHWPDKTVRLVVPYSPGGTTDYAARQVAQKLSEKTGQSFIVENKTGASGTIATQDVVRSAPDGSTFLVTDTTYTMLPLQFAKLPWDYKNDLVHVSEIIETPLVLLVPEQSPFKTMGELIAHAKDHPGKLNFGSGGQASSTHLGAALFASEAGITLNHIPYRGAGAALTDVMAGQIDLLVTAAPTAIPPAQGSRVRALAVSGDTPLPSLKGVPTFAQAGLPTYQVVNWFGLAAPKGTPAAVVEKMNRLVNDIMSEPEMQEKMARQGASHRSLSVSAFGTYVDQQVALWAEAGKRVGIAPD